MRHRQKSLIYSNVHMIYTTEILRAADPGLIRVDISRAACLITIRVLNDGGPSPQITFI